MKGRGHRRGADWPAKAPKCGATLHEERARKQRADFKFVLGHQCARLRAKESAFVTNFSDRIRRDVAMFGDDDSRAQCIAAGKTIRGIQ